MGEQLRMLKRQEEKKGKKNKDVWERKWDVRKT